MYYNNNYLYLTEFLTNYQNVYSSQNRFITMGNYYLYFIFYKKIHLYSLVLIIVLAFPLLLSSDNTFINFNKVVYGSELVLK